MLPAIYSDAYGKLFTRMIAYVFFLGVCLKNRNYSRIRLSHFSTSQAHNACLSFHVKRLRGNLEIVDSGIVKIACKGALFFDHG